MFSVPRKVLQWHQCHDSWEFFGLKDHITCFLAFQFPSPHTYPVIILVQRISLETPQNEGYLGKHYRRGSSRSNCSIRVGISYHPNLLPGFFFWLISVSSLFGITVVQVYTYFYNFPKDWKPQKYAVRSITHPQMLDFRPNLAFPGCPSPVPI